MNVRFYALPNRRGDNYVKIYCYVRKNYQTLVIPTDVRILLKHWDKKLQVAKIGTPNAVLMNKKLAKIRETIEAIILTETTENLNIPTAELFRKIKERFQQTQATTIIELIDYYLKANTYRLSENFVKKIKTVRNQIKDYNPNLTTFQIDKKFVDAFSNFLIEKNLTNATIAKCFKLLGMVLRWNMGRHIAPFDISFLKYKGAENSTTFALTLDEIKAFASVSTKTEAESLDKDAFLFACFTGLRFGDVKNFSKASICDGFIEIVQSKTKQKNLIYILPPAQKTLDKYNKIKPFEKIDEHLTNRRLKTLAKRAGLNRLINITIYRGASRHDKTRPIHELISFHTARRSFATIMTSANLNPDLIKAMTGHRTHREFERYIKFTDEQLKELASSLSILN